MTMSYTCTLACGGCKAALTFTDERPAWKTYDYRVEQAEECERSARFVAEHADAEIPLYPTEQSAALNAAYRDAGFPQFVKFEDFSRTPMGERGLCLAIPEPYRYVECPVCDAQIKEPPRA